MFSSYFLLLKALGILPGVFNLSQETADFADTFLGGFPCAVEGDVGVFFIKGRPFGVKLRDVGAVFHGNASGFDVADPFFDFPDRQFQIDGIGLRFQRGHGFCAVNGASSGGDDAVRKVLGADHIVFDLQESVGAVLLDDIAQAAAVTALYEQIRVRERFQQAFRQQDADGAFAGAGHTDEDDIAFHYIVSSFVFEYDNTGESKRQPPAAKPVGYFFIVAVMGCLRDYLPYYYF